MEAHLSRAVAETLARGPAEAVVRALVPDLQPGLLGRLHGERVYGASDLALLDKDDLGALGFGLVARSRVLAWARLAFPPEEAAPGRVLFKRQNSGGSAAAAAGGHGGAERVSCDLRLDAIEKRADFWCKLAGGWALPLTTRVRRTMFGVNQGEVRESLLESVFDLSHERVREVWESVGGDGADGGKPPLERLRWGLAQYGITDPAPEALERLQEVVAESRDVGMDFAGFETAVSRLLLAHIVTLLEADGGIVGSSSIGSTSRLRNEVLMSVWDYSQRSVSEQRITDATVRAFFFGHRALPTPQDSCPVRWVHMRGFNLNLLLGLTVKYNLHPLAVEDTIDQAPSKADRFGPHYFTTIEGLCLSRPQASDGEPVSVFGYHVAVFCAGPPLLDTVITVAQEDASFAEDWPAHPGVPVGHHAGVVPTTGPAAAAAAQRVDRWAEKIRGQLNMTLSRIRDRRADFLIYKVLDTITDELMAVIRAYTARLAWIEGTQGSLGAHWPRYLLAEVVLNRRQLGLVMRRTRGLQRSVKKFIDDRDIGAGLAAYLQDIVEHLDEVSDDCERLGSKCGAMADAHDRAVDRDRDRQARMQAECTRRQEQRRAAQADRQNNILFVLTAVTTVFAPVQFIAGVYGMNFVDSNGQPTIPELLWPNGYSMFWVAVCSYFCLVIVLGACAYCCWSRREQTHQDDSGSESALPRDMHTPSVTSFDNTTSETDCGV